MLWVKGVTGTTVRRPFGDKKTTIGYPISGWFMMAQRHPKNNRAPDQSPFLRLQYLIIMLGLLSLLAMTG